MKVEVYFKIMKRVVDEVNVLIGTAGSGHALVGPQMPHGMVKLGPDTISLPCGGYDYNDPKIIGFSHTHLEGVGGRGGRGNILLTATTGELIVDEKEYASRFSHDNETAEVGYYQVLLEDYGVNVELTATEHVGFHRYTFPKSDKAQILIDVGHTLGHWNNCEDGNIEIENDKTIKGYGVYPISARNSSTFTVYFYIKFEKPFSYYGVWINDEIVAGKRNARGSKIGAYDGYCTIKEEKIQVKVGISYVSVEQARYNLEKEIPDWDFDNVKERNKQAWNKLLSRVKIRGGSEDQRMQFYSALYRSLNQPTDYTEYDYYFSGYSGNPEVHPSYGRKFYGDDWAIWDTFRTTHPLQSIIEPERQNDMAETFVRIYEQGGWLPMATAPNLGYNQVMIGHNASSVIAGIYARGFRNFNVQKAYEAMYKTAMEEHPSLSRLGMPKVYKELGYYPGGDEDTEEDTFSVSITMEFTYADWCTAQMAKAVGKMEDYEYFMKRAYNYLNLFDPAVGFIRRKRRNGSWVEPFNPADSFKNGFCECSSWEYTFFVPHDIQGIINLIGGREAFIKKLDDFFAGGHYNYQNETSIQVPFLYNYAGAPWKTQEVVRYYVKNKYNSKPDGLFGEDDAGAMSAWYVFAVLGFYPVCPGQDVYVFSSPVFEKVEIDTGNGNKFTIIAEGASEENIYIQSATLNGEPLDRPWITHNDIVKGGVLKFKMGPEPNKEWGSAHESRPPSMTKETPVFKYENINISSKQIESGEPFIVSVDITNQGALGGETVKVYAGDECISSKIVFLKPGEAKTVDFECRLYKPGSYIISIGSLYISGVDIIALKAAKFEYEDNIHISEYMLPYGSDKWVYASCNVKNIGGMDGAEEVVLYIDDKETDKINVKLAPGESQEVKFKFKLFEAGNHVIRIGRSSYKAVLDIAKEPDEKWCTFSTTRAEYYQAGEHLYIRAAGYQSRPEFGILYLNTKVNGDFDAITQISIEQNTSPYAPAGIIVKNDIRNMEDLQDYVVLGAMSKRGFFFNCHTSMDNYYKPYKYAVDCPETPCWLKLEKRGNVFAGYYSKDGKEWVLINKARVPNAYTSQDVGIFVNSASPEMRMVKFEYFNVIQRR